MTSEENPTSASLVNQVGLVHGNLFYLSENAADVHFVFESGERIPAHKIILADSSDVFNAMFFGPVMEKGDVKIVDASAALFTEFLQFFYLKSIEMTMDSVVDLMTLGEKYNVAGCLNVCESFLLLKSNFTVDNVCQIYGLGILFNREKATEFCGRMIRDNTNPVFQTEGFLNCDREILAHILKLENLSCLEVDVFKACMCWLKRASNTSELTKKVVDDYLGELFYEIRFKSITKDQFTELLQLYANVFSEDDINEIFGMRFLNEYQPKHFSTRVRQLKWNEDQILICNRIKRWHPDPQHNLEDVERIIFTTNQTLLLGFFRCTPLLTQRRIIIGRNVPMIVNISRRDCLDEPHHALYNGRVELGLEESTHTLSKPILISPKIEYEIRLNVQTRGNYASFFKMNSEIRIEPDIVVEFHHDPVYNGEAASVIYELGFNRI